MKKLILPLAIVAMMFLVAAAYTWDSVRTAAHARHRVELADEEMHKHEDRLVKRLTDSSLITPEVQAAVSAYQSATDPDMRHKAYEELSTSFQKTMAPKADPTNPLDRKFMDDIAAGAINRREVAQKQYDEESAAYQAFLGGIRGSLAKTFSSHTPADSTVREKR